MLCPLVTVSPSVTNSVVSKFEYIVLYPSLCSIITVNPYLGSFFIDFTVPSSAAFTIVVLGAFISIPLCTTHSCKVSENTRFSIAKLFNISPSTGYTNSNGFTGSSTITGSGFSTSGVVFSCSILPSVSCVSFSIISFVVSSIISFIDLLISELASSRMLLFGTNSVIFSVASKLCLADSLILLLYTIYTVTQVIIRTNNNPPYINKTFFKPLFTLLLIWNSSFYFL